MVLEWVLNTLFLNFVKEYLIRKTLLKSLEVFDTRAFCYIDDAVQASVAVMREESCNGEVIHIGNSKGGNPYHPTS